MHGGATGRVMADLLLERPPTLITREDLELQFGVLPLLSERVREPVEEMSL